MGSLHDKEFTITVPAIRCSFPLRMHPDAPYLIEMGNAFLVDWCKRIAALCESIELAAKLFSSNHNINSGYGLLVTLYYANAISTQRVLPVLKLMNWFFLMDTCVDEPSMLGTNPAKCMHIIDTVMALFEPTGTDKLGKPNRSLSLAGHDRLSVTCGEAYLEDVAAPPAHALRASQHDEPHDISSVIHSHILNPTTLDHVKKPPLHDENTACDKGSATTSHAHLAQELAHILTSAAEEWWSDMCVDMPLSQQARFSEIFRGYLSCIRKETPFRSACVLPNAQTYLCIRSETIAWQPLGLLTEYTLNMELEQEVVINPLVKALMDTVCEMTVITNDIASFCKEYERGDHFNLIMVLCFQKLMKDGGGATAPLPSSWPVELVTPELLQESMNEACEMLKERDHRCVCVTEKIKETRELMEKPGMGAFLEAMGNYVVGGLYWHLTSERYWKQLPHYIGKSRDQIVVNGMADVLGSRSLLLKPHVVTP